MHRYEQLAIELGITVNNLADSINVPVSTIRMGIKRGTGISAEIANKLVTYYPEVSYDWVVNGEGDIFTMPKADALKSIRARGANAGKLSRLLQHLSITAYQFERNIGEPRSKIDNAIKRNSKLKVETINKITRTYPQVSRRWLEEGVEPMLLSEDQQNEPPSKKSVVDIINEAGKSIIAAFFKPANVGQLTKEHADAASQFTEALERLKHLSQDTEKPSE